MEVIIGMERTVTQVKFRKPPVMRLKRVAAYSRVSSGKDAMLHSLSAQISYYSELIQHHPGWVYCGVFSDEAMTGTKASRPGFQALLQECRAGNIDLIITKSISRFARNTVTLLETVRELKERDIDVYFEEQRLHTIGPDGELIMTILAAYAQEESLSVSENQKWRVKKNFEDGKPWDGTLIGYRYVDGKYVVQPDEAEIVRRIFREYLAGKGVDRIANELNADGLQTRLGFTWRNNGVLGVLRNYSYTGNLLLQKYYRADAISKRSRLNDGKLPQYHASNSHEAIVSMEDYTAVQRELERRSAHYAPRGKNYDAEYPYSGLIICGICGKKFRRKITKTGPVWICSTYNTKGKAACPSKRIPERVLDQLTADIDLSGLAEIRAENGNRLIFGFRDGHEIERQWEDRSRAESWTEDMRKAARKRELQRQEAENNGNSQERHGYTGEDQSDNGQDREQTQETPGCRIRPSINGQG